MTDAIPQYVTNRLNAWWYAAWFWTILHYAVGSTGIVAAALGPVLRSYDGKTGSPTLAAITAFCMAAVTFTRARENADLYWAAWRALDSGVRKVLYEGETSKDLNKAIDEGEKILTNWVGGQSRNGRAAS